MNNENATIGIIQMRSIKKIIKQNIDNGKYFDKSLQNIPGVELLNYYSGSKPSYWLYTMKIENRCDFIKMMKEKRILVSELHKRNDLHDFLNDYPAKLPELDKFYSKLIHIPSGWWVTKEDREYIVDCIKKGW